MIILWNKIKKDWRFRWIGKQVRAGIIPKGVEIDEIWAALKFTRPSNAAEMFGVLQMKVFNPDGSLKQDCGIQSVKLVTAAFTEFMTQSLVGTASRDLSDFNWHGCGAGSTAESNSQTTLVSEDGTRDSGSQDTGVSDNIYLTVGSITATSAWTAIEHAIFNTAANGDMLDRSLVATPPTLITDDEVVFTYNLTINAET